MGTAALSRSRTSSRSERSRTRLQSSTRTTRQQLSNPTTVVTSSGLGQRFIQQFGHVDPAELAQHAETTKEAARLWLRGERTINLESALKLARSTREGKFWLATEMGFDSPQDIARLLSILDRHA